MTRTLGLSADLGRTSIALAIGIAVLGLLLLALELRRSRAEGAWLVAASGLVAAVLALAALLRPVKVMSRGTLVGPKVVVLVDRSRSMLLPDDGAARDAREREAFLAIKNAAKDARIALVGFGEGGGTPLESLEGPPRMMRSDLTSALRDVLEKSDELPAAIVVVGDGRFDAPSAGNAAGEIAAVLAGRSVPIHTVSVASREPADASIRAVRAAGAAVAHQPLSLTVEVGCSGGLPCESLPVTVRELLDGAPPALLASGIAKVENGSAVLDLPLTLDRAGPRLVEVAVESPEGDEIRDNDRRILVFDVSRERVRVLHVAGHPTYDVRALRMWLKGNASVDVVAFFILRTEKSDVNVASDNELALIRFPVDELFTEHLPSFDAVILQNFNAVPYRLVKYLPNLTNYVERGGGLVMVGGPDAFLGGHYDGTDLERVLPVKLDKPESGATFDLGDVVPRPTEAGKAAPMLAPLRALFGDDLPSMPGCNLVGDAKPGALTLWEHPTRKTKSGAPMPLLTLGEFGDGRSVAIAVDGAHRLGFSEFAARYAGRGHGALWDGLLGWLMRDPRFEPAQVEVPGACIAGEPVSLRVTPLPGTTGTVSVEVASASESRGVATGKVEIPASGGPIEVPVGTLAPGGYLAKVKVGTGGATRRAFACEKGGDEWADSRPDEERLRAIAKAGKGTFVRAKDAGSLVFPAATMVNAERTVTPVMPPWVWTLCAAVAMGGHWVARRRAGLA